MDNFKDIEHTYINGAIKLENAVVEKAILAYVYDHDVWPKTVEWSITKPTLYDADKWHQIEFRFGDHVTFRYFRLLPDQPGKKK